MALIPEFFPAGRMSNKNWGALLLAAALLMCSRAQPVGGVEPAAAHGAEQKILEKFVGDWRASYRVPKCEWSPQEKSGTADLTTDRIVGGKFIQEKSEHSDSTSGSTLLTYDELRKCYRSWWFSSTGQMSESAGQWDAASRTMIWTSAKDDVVSTTKHRFVDDDNAQWSVLVKDARGKVYMRIEGTSVRAQSAKDGSAISKQ